MRGAGQLRHAGGAQAQAEAYGRLYRTMLSQASTLSYLDTFWDTFWLLGVIAAIMFVLSFLLRSNHPRKADAQAMPHQVLAAGADAPLAGLAVGAHAPAAYGAGFAPFDRSRLILWVTKQTTGSSLRSE